MKYVKSCMKRKYSCIKGFAKSCYFVRYKNLRHPQATNFVNIKSQKTHSRICSQALSSWSAKSDNKNGNFGQKIISPKVYVLLDTRDKTYHMFTNFVKYGFRGG